MTRNLLLWSGCFLLLCSRSAGQAQDDRFLDGLRQRRLFDLADAYCQAQLAREDLTAVARTELTMQRIRTQATRALHTPRGERGGVWDRAEAIVLEFRKAHPQDPRLILIETQYALTTLLQGELARQEAEVLADPGAAREQARKVILAATRQLQDILKRLAVEIPRRHRTPAQADELTAEELISLQTNVQLQLVRAYRNQALCYSEGSNDQIAALTLATRQIEQVLSQLPPDDPMLVSLQLEEAICRRLLGEPVEAARLHRIIESTARSPEMLLNARAEMVRLLLSQQQTDRALAVLDQGRESDGQVTPEFDLAHIEVYLAEWQQAKRANDDRAAQAWQQKSLAMVKQIEQSHGTYWSRRAELMLVDVASASGSANWGILARTAENLFRKQEFDQAIDAYEKAGAAALKADDRGAAFEMYYKAALIDHQRKRHDSASRRFRKLAVELQGYDSASDAHLAAIWNLSQAARADATRLPEYEALCEEHLQLWRTAESADQVRIWLARLRESEGEWHAAAFLYQDVNLKSPHAEAAIAGAGRCYRSLLADAENPQPTAEAAIRYFDTAVAEGGAAPAAVVWGNRFRLRYAPEQSAVAEQQLRAALAGGAGDESWRIQVRCLLVTALAAQSAKASEAMEMLDELQAAGATTLLELLEGLNALEDASTEARSTHLTRVRLAVLERLRAGDAALPPVTKLKLGIDYAGTLAALERRNDARREFQRLISDHPDQGGLQDKYAQFLLDSNEPTLLREALDQWRIVAARSRPQSDRWFRAKYAVALASYKVGDKMAAAKLIRYVKATSSLSADWSDSFDKLLEKCE